MRTGVQKIVVGIALTVVGYIVTLRAMMRPSYRLDQFGMPTFTGMSTGLYSFGLIIVMAGGILITWGIYQWWRNRMADTIAEGIRRSQEREKSKQ